jgi:hypothetical protein
MMRYLIDVMVPYQHNNILLYLIIVSMHNNYNKKLCPHTTCLNLYRSSSGCCKMVVYCPYMSAVGGVVWCGVVWCGVYARPVGGSCEHTNDFLRFIQVGKLYSWMGYN